MRKNRWSRHCRLWAGLTCCIVAGCFTGEYTSRLEDSINRLNTRGEKAAAVFGAATPLTTADGTGTGIQLQYPVFVDSQAKPLQVGSENAQPPFAEIPGLAYAYEVPFEGEPAYAYFAAVPVADKSAEELAEQVQSEVADAFSDASWQQVTLENFNSGESVSLRRLRVSGPQQFGSQRAEGTFELYLITNSNYTAFVGWRASEAVASAEGVWDKVAVAMGTVSGAN